MGNGKVFFTSDTHFNHEKMLRGVGWEGGCQRPFRSVEDMNDALVSNWNNWVGVDDTVYHLGDFCMGKRDAIPEILPRLQGRIVLVAGNHDYKRDDKYFFEAGHSVERKGLDIELEASGRSWAIHMRHQPYNLTPGEHVDFCLCGHVHERWRTQFAGAAVEEYRRGDRVKNPAFTAKTDICNVGVDQWNYAPVTIEEILLVLERR